MTEYILVSGTKHHALSVLVSHGQTLLCGMGPGHMRLTQK